MIPFDILVAGGLGIANLCLLLFWMLRQQKFFHEISSALRNQEQRNREAQRDLFLILRLGLGLSGPSCNSQAGLDTQEERSASSGESSPIKEEKEELTLDEVRILVALATEGILSIATIRSGEGEFVDLWNQLRSLREKGFIFYSDHSDLITILPKGRHYVGHRAA